MTEITQLFVIALTVATALAGISVWSPRRLVVKLGAIGTAAVFLPVAYLAFVELLSKPKPVNLEWWHARVADAEVLGSQIREDQGIYLYLQMPDVHEPRSYVLPWDRQLAEELQAALRDAERNGNGLRMRLPFEPSLDDREPKFYALPQPALPPKDDLPGSPAREYERPGIQA
jgi:hypothetical protein